MVEEKIITLQNISLSKQEEPKVAHEKVFLGKLVVAPTDTSNKEFMVESEEELTKEHEEIPQEEHGNEEDVTEEHEEMPQEENQNEEESIELPSLKESRTYMSKKEEPTIKFVAYRHPHHPKKQQSSRKCWEHQRAYYRSRWNEKGKQYGSTWRSTRNT